MRSTSSLITAVTAAASCCGLASAFPSLPRSKLSALASPQSPHIKRIDSFNAKDQLISVSGEHAWVAPTATDQRGPCPGLNALANHGYLPHNGVGTIGEFIDATVAVYGMGLDLATFLAVYGALFDGNLLGWSIGGSSSNATLLGLIDQPTGLIGSHNNYESDGSPSRGDLYQYGNDYLIQLSQFQALYDLGKATNNYNIPVLTEHRGNRFAQSVAENPYFFNGVFSGLLVQPAGYTFAYRFMANHTAEEPDGVLTGDVLKSFFAITGDDGDFTYTPGYERIPENWYRRSELDAYSIPFFLSDVAYQASQYPEFISVGGNTGTVNSFTGIDLGNLTKGLYNAQTLLEGDNLGCFALQAAIQALPDVLINVVSDLESQVNALASILTNATTTLTCPELPAIDRSQFNAYPGFNRS